MKLITGALKEKVMPALPTKGARRKYPARYQAHSPPSPEKQLWSLLSKLCDPLIGVFGLSYCWLRAFGLYEATRNYGTGTLEEFLKDSLITLCNKAAKAMSRICQ